MLKEKFPLVSIILPVYNGEKFLAESLESCINQSYSNIEIIVINDCSTDFSLNIMETYAKKDKRVRVYSNSENKNLPASLNIGHRLAKGELFTWTSDDNFFEVNAIEVLVNNIVYRNVDIVFSGFKVIKENGIYFKEAEFKNNSCLLFENTIGACFLYKRSVFKRNKGYDISLHTIEDYDFWLQSSFHSNFFFIPSLLYNYRRHNDSLSSELKHSDKFNIGFSKAVQRVYLKYFLKFRISNAAYYANIFRCFHLNQEVDVFEILKNYNQFILDLNPVFNVFEKHRIIYLLDVKIRMNIFNFEENQNFKILSKLIYFRPHILLKYEKSRSIRIIWKCIS